MKKLLISVLIIAVLMASGCISDKDATTEEPTENTSQIDAVPLIPREVLFGNPDKITVRLSPDGCPDQLPCPGRRCIECLGGTC
uniref:Uncharacterized protein n=1 Tax=Candidatus Methanogaster sp. ANME-2c ERB4 TaxID=2759911 RepID=A0A7G9YFH9_9EURY|nr:hypothetical protein DEIDBPHB_00012 [Methanosarcinales archaeon ANME-2c ERB4]